MNSKTAGAISFQPFHGLFTRVRTQVLFFASVTIFSQCRQNFGNFGFFFVFSPQVLLVNNFDFNNFWAFGPDVSLRPNFFVNLCNFFLPNKFHILESERSPIDKNDDFKIFLRGM